MESAHKTSANQKGNRKSLGRLSENFSRSKRNPQTTESSLPLSGRRRLFS
jgi:hypothetical protein